MNLQFELERAERLIKDLKALRFQDKTEINSYKMKEGIITDGAICCVDDWADFQINTPWKTLEDHRWFRTTFIIPKHMDCKHVEFIVTTGREGQWDATNPQMLFYLNGKIVQGVDVNHREITISKKAQAGKSYDVAIYAFSGSVSGDLIIQTHLSTLDDQIDSLYYDLLIPIQAARVHFRDHKDDCRKILQKLELALNTIDLRKPYSDLFYHSLSDAKNMLKKEFYTKLIENIPKVSAIGHTHIDIAWLWTVAQTKEKVLRSFSTVLQLMKQYPDYKFMSSQPILYQFVKEQEPEMYEEIKKYVAEGRWEVDGAMWLEADCNLPSGESFVRQIIKGHRFFKEEFGKESKSLWLPDVFGYSAALPQILKKSGISYFMTTKIAWNQYNQLPNDTFWWKGIDGSKVFVFMPTTCDYDRTLGLNISFTDTRNTTTYTGIINPNMTLGTYERFQNKDLTEDTLMLFGFGDGGGGPTKEMLESAERLKYGLPGIPQLIQEPEQDFFDRTYQKIAEDPNMPDWNGELYFEYHRGTYTSIAKAKRNNRKSEILYEQLETLGSFHSIFLKEYPLEIIKKGWDTILLNQFHDIIPGSSIEAVYTQADKEYREIECNGNHQLSYLKSTLSEYFAIEKDEIMIFNTQGYYRSDIVEIALPQDKALKGIEDENGNIFCVQKTHEHKYIFYANELPPVGFKKYKLLYEVPVNHPEINVNSDCLKPLENLGYCYENSYYKAEFNQAMQLISLYEKESKKQFMKEGEKGNLLQAYEDRPMNWDNWDIDIFYQKKPYLADSISTPEVIEDGNYRTILRTKYRFMDSLVIQDIYFYKDIPRIDFYNKVSWHEHNVLLRVHFPVNMNAVKASYEIQFGNVERETTSNHSWDTAKFETCGHKWADLSEYGAGISLLNDCKYGYRIKNEDISLTLIKSGTYPHPNADIGEHEFIYSIYPHPNGFRESKTIEMAYNLNVPLHSVVGNAIPTNKRLENPVFKYSLLSCNQKNCFFEVIKQAEDGNGYIIRMYENHNKHTNATITAGFSIKEVYECNLLEHNEQALKTNGQSFDVSFHPYEIKTFRIITN